MLISYKYIYSGFKAHRLSFKYQIILELYFDLKIRCFAYYDSQF